MNRAFKTVWNDRTQSFVAVPETTRARGKRSGAGAALAACGVLALSAVAAPAFAVAGPPWVITDFHSLEQDVIGTTDESLFDVRNEGSLAVDGKTVSATAATASYNSNPVIAVANGGSVSFYNGAKLISEGDYKTLVATSYWDAASAPVNISFKESTLSTSGNGSEGIRAAAAMSSSIVVDVENSSITTHGISSAAIDVQGNNATATLQNATITTYGYSASGVVGYDSATMKITGGSITTAGDYSPGVTAWSNAKIAVSGTSITTTGSSSYGVDAENGGVELNGVTVHTGADGRFSTFDVSSSDASYGLYAYSSQGLISGTAEVITKDRNAHGILASTGGKITLTDSGIETLGAGAYGAVANNGTVTLTGGSVHTANANAYGLASVSTAPPVYGRVMVPISSVRGELTANNVIVTTLGDGSHGVVAGGPFDQGNNFPSILAAGAPAVAQGAIATINGGTVTTSGAAAHGLYAKADSTINATSTTVLAKGRDSYAAVIENGGSLNANGSALISKQSDGIQLNEAAKVTLNGTRIESQGNTFSSWLSTPNANQTIVVGAGSNLTRNNGTLLSVGRKADGNGKVVLDLQDGSVSSGAIVDSLADLANLNDDTGTYVTVGNQAIFNGTVSGLKEFTTAEGSGGQQLTFAAGSQMGTLRLTGNNAVSHGGTIDNPIVVTNDVDVSNAAVFGGNWKIAGTLTTSNGAFIRPGNSIGVVEVKQINWGPGTTYDVEINKAGEADRVNVTGGGADLSQTALRVGQENGNGGYKLNYDYTVLTATGAITPFVSSAYTGTDLIKLDTVYSPNQVAVRLSVDPDKLGELPTTPNQGAVVDGTLPSVGANPAVDDAYQAQDPAKAFDQLSGEVHASTRSALIASASLLPDTISQRLRGNLDAGLATGAPTAAAGAAGSASALPSSLTRPVWGQVVGNWQKLDGKNGSAGVRQDLYGIYLGGDAEIGGGWRLGGVFGYTDSNLRVSDRQSRADIDSYTAGVYTGNSWKLGVGRVNTMVGAAYTWHDVDTRRNVTLGGNQNLKASYDAESAQIFGELGYAIPVNYMLTLEPYAGVAYLRQHTAGYREDGGLAALRGQADSEDVTTATLGLRTRTVVQIRQFEALLQAGAGWRHASGTLTPQARQSLVQGAGNTFTVAGAPVAQNAAVVDLGAEVAVSRSTALGLSYTGQFGDGNRDNAGGAYVRIAF